MRIDVSEIKTYRECKRKHQFSSRNRLHLVPMKSADNLIFGTQFHEVLHAIYLGTPIEKVLEWIRKEVDDSVYQKTMLAMAEGYYNNIYLPKDKDRYEVVDIEKSFSIPIGVVGDQEPGSHAWEYQEIDGKLWGINPTTGEMNEAIVACGSIDMIAIDTSTSPLRLVGFEHKTAKNFRPEVYNVLDEQPRLYSIALRQILKDYHKAGKLLEVTEVGPIYLNQVKKLQKNFDSVRTECMYSNSDLRNFMRYFLKTTQAISEDTKHGVEEPLEPGYMRCQLCDYANLCMHYGYGDINKEELLDEFSEEYHVREVDHLDEKLERSISSGPIPDPSTEATPNHNGQVSREPGQTIKVNFGGK